MTTPKKNDTPTWAALEAKVRKIAAAIWGVPCVAETISGVRIDGICRITPERFVLVEVTERRDLDKVRTDILKLDTCRRAFAADSIFAECYMVTDEEPTSD
ncbi:MAG: hypothetical protein L6Q76_36055, partial [Polyangiaceae bacterium]|nr:hypothetical protein [Polyangiaceae bacterium]